MKRVVVNCRDFAGDWCNWHTAWLVAEHPNTWRVWGLRHPFTTLIHKQALGIRVLPL